MDRKKQLKVLTKEELESVTGGAREFVEPGDALASHFKFSPLTYKFAPLTYKFSPLA